MSSQQGAIVTDQHTLEQDSPAVRQHSRGPAGNVRQHAGKIGVMVMLGVFMLAILNSRNLRPPPKPEPQATAGARIMSPAEATRGLGVLKDSSSDDRKAIDEDQEKRKTTDYKSMNDRVDARELERERETTLEEKRREMAYASLFAPQTAFAQAEAKANPQPETTTTEQKPSTAEAPKSPQDLHTLYRGSIIETVLTNTIDGSFPGPVNLMVTTGVYTLDGVHLLIPQGAKILGQASAVAGSNQERIAVSLDLLQVRNRAGGLDEVPLNDVSGLDQQGAAALKDKVDNHVLSKIGYSLLLGGIGGLVLSGSAGGFQGGGTDYYRQGVAQSMGTMSQEILRGQMQRLPTITINARTRVKLILNQNLKLVAR